MVRYIQAGVLAILAAICFYISAGLLNSTVSHAQSLVGLCAGLVGVIALAGVAWRIKS